MAILILLGTVLEAVVFSALACAIDAGAEKIIASIDSKASA